MADLVNEIPKGKESFFIRPDGSVISEYLYKDYEIQGVDWFSFINQLQSKYPELCIGSTYLKRNSLSESVNLEHSYFMI